MPRTYEVRPRTGNKSVISPGMMCSPLVGSSGICFGSGDWVWYGSRFSVQAPARSNLYEPTACARMLRAGRRLKTNPGANKITHLSMSDFYLAPGTGSLRSSARPCSMQASARGFAPPNQRPTLTSFAGRSIKLNLESQIKTASFETVIIRLIVVEEVITAIKQDFVLSCS